MQTKDGSETKNTRTALSRMAIRKQSGRALARRVTITWAAVFTAVLTLVAPFFLSDHAIAATTNKTVYGVVYDQIGNGLNGADVTVEIWGAYWPDRDFLRTSNFTVTDSAGYYQVTISSNYWDPHNTIKIIAAFDGNQKIRMIEANDSEDQEVNVHMDFTIPELGSPLLLLVILAGWILPVVILQHRREK